MAQQRRTAFQTLEIDGRQANFQVFLASDLSLPMAPYRMETLNDYGTKFVLPEAPFFIRVFFQERMAEGSFEFRAHRYTGRSRAEAIALVPHEPQAYAMPTNGPLNVDDPTTTWNEGDAVWFRADTHRADSGREQALTFRLSNLYGAKVFDVMVLREEPSGALQMLGATGPVPESGTLTVSTAERIKRYLLVKRDDPRVPPGHPDKYKANEFVVGWTTNLTLLYGDAAGVAGIKLSLPWAPRERRPYRERPRHARP